MTHCALVGVLSLAAFTSQQTFKPITDNPEPIPLMVIPDKLVDGETKIGGGGPKPPAVQERKQEEPAPAPKPTPAPAPVPEPPKPVAVPAPAKIEHIEPPKAEKPLNAKVVNEYKVPDKRTKQKPKTMVKPQDDEDDAPPKKTAKTNEPKKVAVNLSTVVRNSDDAAKHQKEEQIRQRNEAIAAQRAMTERKNAFANIGKNLNGLQDSISSGGVSIDMPAGPGIGPSFVNYAQWVKEIYDRNWTVSDAVIGDDGVVRVEIVVQRNGTARGKIVKSSGNAALDRTVQNAINRVSNIGYPFPAGSTDNTRTFIINFNLSSKRQTG